MKIKSIYIFILIVLISSFLSGQTATADKMTTVNVMISTIYSTNMGLIIEYYSDGKMRECYMPNSFFEDRTVVKIIEDNPTIAPQMNVVYKNNEPYKVKLYVPTYPNGLTYQAIPYLPDDKVQLFNNTKKLAIILKEDQKAVTK
jgi:hypothetical protein